METKENAPKDAKDPEICRYGALCAGHLGEVLRSIQGRWKMHIVGNLLLKSPMRFSDLERAIPQASQKMLTQHLRELERDGIVARTAYPQVPPKVEYRLTDEGRGLRPVFLALLDWADARGPQKNAPSAAFAEAKSKTRASISRQVDPVSE